MKGNLKFSIYPRELLFSIFLVLLPLGMFAQAWLGIEWASYSDEVLCILCAFYLVYKSFKHGIQGFDLAILILLAICIIIGLVGNLQSHVISEGYPIVVDIIVFAKMFFVYLVYKLLAKSDKKQRIASYLLPISKLMLLLSSLLGTLNLFMDIGMSSDIRYGIRSFAFVFSYDTYNGYFVCCCLAIILLSNCKSSQRIFYEVLTVYNMILTTKGAVYIALACFLVLSIMWKRKAKLSVGNIILLAIAGISVSTFQINNYLMDSESARMRLLRYGVRTANTYFPFGSGFATYASGMSVEYYSPLYIQYGFDKFHGLSRDFGPFLLDNYAAMLLGQFGYIGTALFVVMLVLIFIPINKIKHMNNNNILKALLFSIFIGLIISCIGLGLIRSNIGVLIFAILGLVSGYSEAKQLELANNDETISDKSSTTTTPRKRRTIKFK